MYTPPRILGVGSPLVDALAHVSEEFLSQIPGNKGSMELIEHSLVQDILNNHRGSVTQAPGGSAANTILGLAKLGIACAFIGKLGKDDLATFYKDQLIEAGVEISGIKYCETSPTGRCISLITPDTERTLRTHLGAACNLQADDIYPSDFADFTHVHIEGHLLHNDQLLDKVLLCAHEADCTISYDMGNFDIVTQKRSKLRDLLSQYVDMVFANEQEAEAYGESDKIEQTLELLSSCCAITAIKIGAEGSWIQDKNERIHIPAFPAQAVDSTGAGDLWAVGFLWAYYQGHSLKDCGRAASLLGASVVEQIGAMIPDLHWERIKEQLNEPKYTNKNA